MTSSPAAGAGAASREGLGARLRDGTWDLHRRAEVAGAMAALLRGELPAAVYRELLVNLQALYSALEDALEAHATHPGLAPLFDRRLHRSAALAADLASLPAPSGATAALRPAMVAYVARVAELAEQAPALLAAHAYVRYLGDLHGGQVLARRVRALPDLPPDVSTGFYDFGDAAAVSAQVRAFRAGLAALPADEAQTEALVAEARRGFEAHVALFEQLQPA